MRIRKNILMLSLIAMFLMPMLVVSTYANGAILAISPAETTQASGTFYIEITVAGVTAMWGYQIKLVYDTSALTATASVSNYPFEAPQGIPPGGEINDAEGYITMVYSMPMGEPDGFDPPWEPYPIATIEFTVDGPGASPLTLKESIISDIHGDPISHVAYDGEFRTETGLPIASFVWTPGGEDPIVGETLTFTSTSTDADGWIVDFSWDFGDGTTGTGAEVTHTYTAPGDFMAMLTVTDNDGKTDGHVRKVLVSEIIVYGPVDLRNTHAAHRRFGIAERDPMTVNPFTAWVKNLSPDQETLVMVMWSVVHEGIHLGEVVAEGSIAPKALAQFTADFDVLDPAWQYDGERIDYEIWTTVFYQTTEYPYWTDGTYSGVKTNWFQVTTLP